MSAMSMSSQSNNTSSFVPDQECLQTLKDMGFSEPDAVYALEITRNNIEHSVNFLMSNPNPTAGMSVRMAPPTHVTNARPNTGMSSSSSAS